MSLSKKERLEIIKGVLDDRLTTARLLREEIRNLMNEVIKLRGEIDAEEGRS